MPRRRLAELLLFVLTVAWGYTFVAIPWALRDCGVMALTGMRMTVGLVTLVALRPRMGWPTSLEWRAGVLGGLLLAGAYVLQTAGLVETGSGRSGFITAYYVAIVPLFEGLVFRRLPSLRDLAALAVATAGITVMALSADLSMSPAALVVGASALFWSAQIVVIGRVAQRTDPMRLAGEVLTTRDLVGGALVMAAVAATLLRPVKDAAPPDPGR
jgi:drug/metabolite transporter (DMT)-like permease